MQKITPMLWFDKQAGEAAKFYTSVFKDGKIISTQTLTDTPSGTVEVLDIEILGQRFTLMSAGPLFKFNEAISFQVFCDSQEEVDYYWEKMSAVPESEQCGWLKDKFGVSWQIIPTKMTELLSDPDPKKAQATTQAMLQMKKLDLAKLQEAHDQA